MGSPPRRLLAIANPAAGRGAAVRRADELARRLTAQAEVTLAVTEAPGHARELAAAADLGALDGLLVVGGDGTLHEAVDGMLGRSDGLRVPVGAVPAGSGDSLAFDLGLDGFDAAVDAVAAGGTRAIDLARLAVDGRVLHAFNLLGWGASARINRRAEGLRWARGLRYDLATALELLRPRVPDAGVTLDGEPVPHILGALCMTRHVGRRIPLAPGALLDDGELDLVLVRRALRPRLLALFAAVLRGSHAASPLVDLRRVRSVEVDLGPGSWIVVDGEALEARRVQARVLPGALHVFA